MFLFLALAGGLVFLAMPAGRRVLFGARVRTAAADPAVPAAELARLFGEALKRGLAPAGVDTTLLRVETTAESGGKDGAGTRHHHRWEVPLPRGLSVDSAMAVVTAAAVPFKGEPLPGEADLARRTWRLRPDVAVEAVFLVPDTRGDGRPRLALLIDEFGHRNLKESEEILGFARGVTVAIPPFATGARDLADRCRRVGLEVAVDMPMEDLNYPQNDPGPGAILVDLSERELVKRIDQAFDRLGGADGLHTMGGNLAVEDRNVMTVVLGNLKRRRAWILDSTRSTFSAVEDVAGTLGVATRKVRSPGALDYPRSTPAQVEARLAELADTARQRGVAVGIVRPYPGTVEALRKMLPEWAASGLEVVPVSEVVAVPVSAGTPPR